MLQPGTEECPEKAKSTHQQNPVETQARENYPTPIDKANLSQRVANFSAGGLQDYVEGWKSLTTDPVILDAIKHDHIEFGDVSPQVYQPKQMPFSPSERDIITEEITKLLDKGVIEQIDCVQVTLSLPFLCVPRKMALLE